MSIVEHDCAREIMLIYKMYDGLYLHETSSGAMYVSKYISSSGIGNYLQFLWARLVPLLQFSVEVKNSGTLPKRLNSSRA